MSTHSILGHLLERVGRDPLCSTAWHSAGGVVAAGEKIANGEITNAFAFIGAGGHHAGRDEFGGYCCFNDVALCIVNLREKLGLRRFAMNPPMARRWTWPVRAPGRTARVTDP